MKNQHKTIGIIGGGPASLFMFQKITETNRSLTVKIFEKTNRLGAGMPYSEQGAGPEHIANVSSNELPKLPQDMESYLKENHVCEFPEYYDGTNFNKYKVIPRLLLGDYMENQYHHLLVLAEKKDITAEVYFKNAVEDLIPNGNDGFDIVIDGEIKDSVDIAIVCTGHFWPRNHENTVEGYFDSPYPPQKLHHIKNVPVAIRGTSLTAIDALRTLSRINGEFSRNENKKLTYQLNPGCENFRLDFFSTGRHLPAIRFHSEDDYLSLKWIMKEEEIAEYKSKNNGFVHLDHIFELSFKRPMKEKDPEFFGRIEHLKIEEFAELMMRIRDIKDPFELFEQEYQEAAKSINEKKSISWKETLSAFSYAMNYPAKHFSAEDMLRLKKIVMPLITIIIAELPQSSAEELMAMHDAGLVSLTEVDSDSTVEVKDGRITYCYKNGYNQSCDPEYDFFIDSVGQKPFDFKEIPYKKLRDSNLITGAHLYFDDSETAEEFLQNDDLKSEIKKSGDRYLMNVAGIQVGDHFEALDRNGKSECNLYIMTVPLIGGLHPDYSGLDFCATAAEKIGNKLKSVLESKENCLEDSSTDVA